MSSTPCPDTNTLSELASGALDGPRREEVLLHLDACSSCRRLAALAAGAGMTCDPAATADAADPFDPAGAALRPGDTFSHYVIVETLGAGAMGVLYAAVDQGLRRKVALKLVRGASGEGHAPSRHARLLREARAAAGLSHPNVVVVYEVGEFDGRAFIAMELVEGGTLREWLASARRRPRDILAMFRQAGEGLAVAHDAGVVHRDFKPDNVLIGRDGRPRVADFGLARQEGLPLEEAASCRPYSDLWITQAGALVGTLAYMSPEQLRGTAADARSDQFAFGVSLYHALFEERPFPRLEPGPTGPDQDLVPLRPRTRSRVRAALRRALLRAIRMAPEERYPDMRSLLRALDAELPGRAPTMAWVGALASVALLTVAALSLRASSLHGGRSPVAPSVAQAPPPVPTTLADMPVPASEIPAARAAYVAGLHALHEGSPTLALPSFLRAAELDPSMAAAHLRVLMWGPYDPSAHEHLARASELRARLSERDERVLWMLEPGFLSTPPDEKEATRRAREVARRWPLDAELQVWVATREEDPPAEVALYERVLSIDPTFGYAFVRLANVYLLLADYDRALDAADRCLALAPSSNGCLYMRANVYEELGRCAELERDARLLVSTSPSARSQDFVARALYANGAPQQAVRAALELKWAAAKGRQREIAESEDEAHLAILRGDFSGAERLEREVVAGAESASTEDEHASAVIPLMELELAMGQDARAAQLAAQYLKARAGWQSDGPWSRLPEMLAVARHGGLLTEGQRAAALAEWLKQWDQLEGPLHTQQWVLGYAIPATTADDAIAALAAASQPLPRVHSNQFHREGLEANGRVLLLAGRAADAVPYLRAATATCSALQAPIEHTQAHFHLGQALEQTADRAGACTAYAVVLQRWGAAKPRSITAERARSRWRALDCGEAP